MTKPKIMTVYGTRPEAIKIAPVIKALEFDNRFESVIVSTGQHREMLDQVHSMFHLFPGYDLGIMKNGQELNEILARAMLGLDEIILAEKPDVILVQGDTSSALAGALSGFHRGVKVVHLEAGLRTGNVFSPFPEEANRKIVTQVASLHLAPTVGAKENLLKENIVARDIVVVGNSVIDALFEAVRWDVEMDDPRLKEITNTNARIVLVTTHRRENLDDIEQIGFAIKELSDLYPDTHFVLPLHLNPLIRDTLLPLIEDNDNVIVTPPLPYDQFTHLVQKSAFILTDSGGIQEEAPALGKPVLVMRESTERTEAVAAGTVKLVGTDRKLIVSESQLLLDDRSVFKEMAAAVNPYGDGKAAGRAIEAIAELFGLGQRRPDFVTSR